MPRELIVLILMAILWNSSGRWIRWAATVEYVRRKNGGSKAHSRERFPMRPPGQDTTLQDPSLLADFRDD